MTKTGLFVLIVTAAIIAAFGWAISGLHAEEKRCGTVVEVVDRLRVDLADYNPKITLMGRDDTTKFLQLFNAEPPVTELAGDELIFIEAQNENRILLVRFEKGCFSVMNWISRAVRDKVMLALGQPT